MSEPTNFLIRPIDCRDGNRAGGQPARDGRSLKGERWDERISPQPQRWQCFEAPGVQPYFVGPEAREQAISYARNCRTAQRHGEIRIYNAAGEIEETIAFDERGSRMRV